MTKDPAGLEVALAHARRGREVFPFRLARGPGGKFTKVPLVKWQSQATCDEATIRAWWSRYPTAMPGWRLPLGTVVADVDDQGALDAAGYHGMLEAASAPSQTTPSGGTHWLFGHDGAARQQVKAVPGLDTRVGGKGWVGLYSTGSFEGRPAEAPAWLLGQYEPEPAGNTSTEAETYSTRDDLLRFAGRMRRVGLEAEQIEELMLGLLREGRVVDLDPARPWTQADMSQIARDIGRKPKPDPAEDAWSPPPIVRRARATAPRIAPAEEGLDAEAFRAKYGAVPLSEVDTSPPPPLVLGRLHPTEQTILFGMGGTGKGVLAAWWVSRLAAGEGGAEPERLLVVDYEGHADEWARRVEAFTGADRGAMGRVLVVEPYRSGMGQMWEAAAVLARLASDWGATRVVVDSIVAACGQGDALDARSPGLYAAAVQRIALPTLHLGHVTKGEGDQRFPFGSVFWHNWARVTWSLSGDGASRTLTCRKTNTHKAEGPFELGWAWATEQDRLPRALSERATAGIQAMTLSDADRIAEILHLSREGTSAKDVAAALGIALDTARKRLNTMCSAGRATMRPGARKGLPDLYFWVVAPEDFAPALRVVRKGEED